MKSQATTSDKSAATVREGWPIRRYYDLTKPRVVGLIVFTAIVGMFLSTNEMVPFVRLVLAANWYWSRCSIGRCIEPRPGSKCRCGDGTYSGTAFANGCSRYVRGIDAGVNAGYSIDGPVAYVGQFPDSGTYVRLYDWLWRDLYGYFSSTQRHRTS